MLQNVEKHTKREKQERLIDRVPGHLDVTGRIIRGQEHQPQKRVGTDDESIHFTARIDFDM